MKAAAVGPILLLSVDDKPFTLPAAGRKGPKQVYRESFALSFYHPFGSFSLLRSVRLIGVTMTG